MAEPVRARRLTDQEGQRLQQIVRRGKHESVRVRRAMIIMASASGTLVPAIARLVAADEGTVWDVIHLFNRKGLAALDPQWAGGRPRLISDEAIHVIVTAAELGSIRLGDVDLDACRIRITQGKGAKDRYVPFPATFKETLALHISAARDNGAAFLFESSWKKPYSTRGVRAMLARYAAKAGLAHNMPPHRLRHFLFTWLKTQGIDDALIQPYSGHATRTSLEIYSRLALADAQHTYNSVIDQFPV